MGRRGPPKLPTQIKIVRGTNRKDRTNPDEPKPDPCNPKPPAWLGREERAEWKRVCAEVVEGVLAKSDRPTLVCYCIAWSNLRAAREILKKKGRTFTTEKGYVGQRPEVADERNAFETMKKFIGLLGLSPADRSNVKVAPKAKPTTTRDRLFGKEA